MEMSKGSKKEYINAVKVRYLKGNRVEKERILDEVWLVCDYHRKHAIRLLNGGPNQPKDSRAKQKRGRKSKYRYLEFERALKKLWFYTDQMCSLNFKEAIPLWLPAFEEEICISEQVEEHLLCISAATIGRILEPSKIRTKKRGGTTPGKLLRTEIPIRTNFWDVNCPGYMEADTVAHCGGSMAGEFVWTLTLTDIDTTWTEIRAVWHKLAENVRDGIIDIQANLPFLLVAFDSDNGNEFINKCLVHYFSGKFIAFTRSREYKKNDNAHVEQKNYTHVRQLLGYSRIDYQKVIPLLNDLFRKEVSQLKNFFYPSLKLSEKHKLINGRVVRIYKKPKTPYQRVLESPHISKEKKNELEQIYNTLNPIKLTKTINSTLAAIFKIVKNEQERLKSCQQTEPLDAFNQILL